MKKIDEKTIDSALERAIRDDAVVTQLFLDRVGLADQRYRYYWSRSDHPWCRMTVDLKDPASGAIKTVDRDSETDVLIVLENESSGKRLALHLENKLSNGKFTPYQPELYARRAQKWIGLEKFKSYEECKTVLVAPLEFYASCPDQSNVFDFYISYEDLASHIPEIKEHIRLKAA